MTELTVADLLGEMIENTTIVHVRGSVSGDGRFARVVVRLENGQQFIVNIEEK